MSRPNHLHFCSECEGLFCRAQQIPLARYDTNHALHGPDEIGTLTMIRNDILLGTSNSIAPAADVSDQQYACRVRCPTPAK